MKNVMQSFCLLLLFACGSTSTDTTTGYTTTETKVPASDDETPSEDFAEEIVSVPDTEEDEAFAPLTEPTYDVAKLDHQGEVAHTKVWQDANGENVLLLTTNKDELYAYHYAIAGDEVKLLRELKDFEKDCEFDLFLSFIEASIEVTDLDEDNFGEVTFAYKKACVSDVSPLGLKLMLLENGAKYAIRGSTTLVMGEGTYADPKEIGPEFTEAPADFLKHANEIWDAVKTTSYD